MRTLPPDLAAHLAGDASMLCHAWRLQRKDGVVLGFTDHDRDLVLDGVTYEAATGLSASEASAETGMVTGGMEVAGALISDRLSEAELAAGAFDHARIETFLVNWSAPEERLLLRVGHIGEVLREDSAFRVEIRGLAAGLDEPQGRVFRAPATPISVMPDAGSISTILPFAAAARSSPRTTAGGSQLPGWRRSPPAGSSAARLPGAAVRMQAAALWSSRSAMSQASRPSSSGTP